MLCELSMYIGIDTYISLRPPSAEVEISHSPIASPSQSTFEISNAHLHGIDSPSHIPYLYNINPHHSADPAILISNTILHYTIQTPHPHPHRSNYNHSASDLAPDRYLLYYSISLHSDLYVSEIYYRQRDVRRRKDGWKGSKMRWAKT